MLREQPPGTYKLYLQTADSLEWGGLAAKYNLGDYAPGIPTHPHATFLEFEFTVPPAEQ